MIMESENEWSGCRKGETDNPLHTQKVVWWGPKLEPDGDWTGGPGSSTTEVCIYVGVMWTLFFPKLSDTYL